MKVSKLTMCDFIPLAALSYHRYLALCSCGCLHLVWDNVTIRFRKSDLPGVLAQLQGAPLAKGEVEIWLYTVGLKLTPDAFPGLLNLLSEAQDALARCPAATAEESQSCTPPLRPLN